MPQHADRPSLRFPELWWVRYLLCLLLVCGLFLHADRTKKIRLELEYQTSTPATLQLFYAYADGPFLTDRVFDIRKGGSGNWNKAILTLKTKKRVQQLGLGLPDYNGEVRIRNLRVTGKFAAHAWNGTELIESEVRHLQPSGRPVDDIVTWASTGNDPRLMLKLPPEISERPMAGWLMRFLSAIFYSLLLFGVIQGSFWLARNEVFVDTLDEFLTKWAGRLSDQRTIVFSAHSFSVMVAVGIFAVLFVSFNLHQSSAGVWDRIYGGKAVRHTFRTGVPKDIRSDEWNTQTPWVLNQVQRGMKIENSNIGGAQSAFVAATPTLHPVMLVQPKFWGFLFLDLEHGYSWIWAFKAFGLFSAFYLLFLLLTQGDGVVSVAGSLWVFGSSFVQWWYSSHLPEILIGFALAVLGALYLLRAGKFFGKLFGAVLVVFSVVNLLLHVYPPFLVPLAYLGVFLVVAFSLQRGRMQPPISDYRSTIWLSVLSMLLIGLFVFSWVQTGRETIDLMLHTSYPGKRVEMGGNMDITRLVYGPFECLRNSQEHFPIPPSNACEASSFVLLFPLLPLMIRRNDLRADEFPLLAGLFLYCLFVLAWMAFPLPEWLRHGFSAMGWSMSPAHRSQVGLGIASITLVTVFAAYRARQVSSCDHRYASLFVAVVMAGLVAAGFWLQRIDGVYFNNLRVFSGALMVSGVLLSIYYRQRIFFLLMIAGMVLPSLTVNPIVSGLDCLLRKPVLIKAVEQGGGPGDKWAVIGSFVFAQGLKAKGLDVVNGSSYAPDFNKILLLDARRDRMQIWNRYAHISLASSPGIGSPDFVLLGPDHFLVKVDVGSDQLRRLGVTHLAYTGLPPAADLQSLIPLESDPESGVYLYKYKQGSR